MLIYSTESKERIKYLAKKYVDLRMSGIEEKDILVILLNSRKKNCFTEEVKKINPQTEFKENKILTFFGLCFNAFSDNEEYILSLINSEPDKKPNLCGLEVSQYIFKQSIKNHDFNDYISKINLLHQLFRRYSLIVQNALTKEEITERSRLLNETFAVEAQKAIEDYKKLTIKYNSFDYLRQNAILPLIYKNTDYFKNIKYLLADDVDEQPYVFWNFVNSLMPSLCDYFLSCDKEGSTRCGYLCAYKSGVGNFIKEYNPVEIEIPAKNTFYEFAQRFSSAIRIGEKTSLGNIKTKSSVKRLKMVEDVFNDIKTLINNGVSPSDMAIITPICDDVLISALKSNKNQIKFMLLTGNEKLNENPTVKNILLILKHCLGIKLKNTELKSLFINLFKIPYKKCEYVIKFYEKNAEFSDYDFENPTHDFAYKKFKTIVNSLKKTNNSLTEQIKAIYENITKEFEITPDNGKYDFLVKEAKSFETAFSTTVNNITKEFLIQIENSIISENPVDNFKINKNAVIVSTPQKIIDYSVETKYELWLDISSNEWVKEDTGMLYNAWVFNRDWEKNEYTLSDEMELTNDKTARIIRKLILGTEKEIRFYSSLYDNNGNENFGGLLNFIKQEKTKVTGFNIVPREDQKPVMNYTGGKMGITAVPGAGKTTILLALIIKLLKENVLPENIFVLTYMESAAKNFKERIKSALPDMQETPNISTIHGLALRIIKENSNHTKVGLDNNFEICDDTTKERLIKGIFYRLKIDEENFDNYLRCISVLKLSGTGKKPYSKYKEIQNFYNFYEEYEKELKLSGYIDYDDMLCFAVKILEENPEILKYYQNLCKYIIEDEAQDSTEIQQRLLKLLSGKHNNLVRCGDINQSITSTFTNSNTEGFKNFINSNKKIEMHSSQRCAKPIYELANKLVKNSGTANAFYPIEMTPAGNNPTDTQKPQFLIFEDEREEKAFILNKAKEISANNPNASVAVLLRLNSQVNDYNEYFAAHGIKTNVRTDCLEQKNIYRIIYTVLKIIDNPASNKNIKELAELYKINKLCKIKKSDIEFLENLKQPFWNTEMEIFNSEGLEQLFWDINYMLNETSSSIADLALKIGLYYAKDVTEKSNTYLISSFIRRIFSSNEYDLTEFLKTLEYNAKRPLGAFKFFEEEQQASDTNINIMTMHKSKGDEFDYVFIALADEENYPTKTENVKLKSGGHFVQTIKANIENTKIKTPEEQKNELTEETLRLLYVGITRAKRELYFTCSKKYKRNKNPKISEFIKNLLN